MDINEDEEYEDGNKVDNLLTYITPNIYPEDTYSLLAELNVSTFKEKMNRYLNQT